MTKDAASLAFGLLERAMDLVQRSQGPKCPCSYCNKARELIHDHREFLAEMERRNDAHKAADDMLKHLRHETEGGTVLTQKQLEGLRRRNRQFPGLTNPASALLEHIATLEAELAKAKEAGFNEGIEAAAEVVERVRDRNRSGSPLWVSPNECADKIRKLRREGGA